MSQISFFTNQLFDGEQFLNNVRFTVEQGSIVSLEAEQTAQAGDIELNGLVSAGYIDVHVNGGGGALINNEPTLQAIKTMLAAHAMYGTTSLLPTLITDSYEVMAASADAVSSAIKSNVEGVLGIHFEGPHLSVAKKGVHQQQWIRQISERESALFKRNDLGIKMLTLAPENVPPATIKSLVEDYQIRVSLGHSNADYDTAKLALEAGASSFTHLYNAMSPLQSRAPGMVGAAIDDEDSWCGIILDGYHMDAVAARVAYKAKPKGKMIIVTDAMSPVGTDDEQFEFFDTQIIRTGDRLNAPTGELAGSVLDMASGVRNAVSMLKVDLAEALRMASLYPAEFLGVAEQKGCLKIGMDADFIELDKDLKVASTWRAANNVFTRGN